MKEDVGDLWTYPAEYRCVTTNGVVRPNGRLVMGAGVALQARERFPGLDQKLGRWVKQHGNRPFLCRKERIISFPTKEYYWENSTLFLVICSATSLAELVNKFGIVSVALTRPGCGNGQLDWKEVRPAIAPILDDRFTVLAPV